jgi:hypothetical protein
MVFFYIVSTGTSIADPVGSVTYSSDPDPVPDDGDRFRF